MSVLFGINFIIFDCDIFKRLHLWSHFRFRIKEWLLIVMKTWESWTIIRAKSESTRFRVMILERVIMYLLFSTWFLTQKLRISVTRSSISCWQRFFFRKFRFLHFFIAVYMTRYGFMIKIRLKIRPSRTENKILCLLWREQPDFSSVKRIRQICLKWKS